jgi:hypothetical protein
VSNHVIATNSLTDLQILHGLGRLDHDTTAKVILSHLEANKQIAVLRAALTSTIKALDLVDEGNFEAAVEEAMAIGKPVR